MQAAWKSAAERKKEMTEGNAPAATGALPILDLKSTQ